MEKKHHILSLSDSDFLSFLYSERDRENSISEYPGWSNWALAGAFVTMLCSAYALIENSESIDSVKVFYYVSGLIALFLSLRIWFFLFKRQRGIDLTKVMFLWDVVPHVLIIFVLLCAVAANSFILFVDSVNPVFWGWLSVLVLLIGAYIIIICHRDKIVSSYPKEVLFWNPIANNHFNALLGGLYGLIFEQSFRLASWNIFNPSFELAICIFAATVSLYAAIKLNVENKVVREFDFIVDAYVYKGVSKEETYRSIVRNRMGYGVLDACSKELIILQDALKKCREEGEALEIIKADLDKEDFDTGQLSANLKRVGKLLGNLRALIKQSKRLSNKMKEMIKVSSSISDFDEVDTIIKVNDYIYEETEMMSNRIDEITRLIQDKIEHIKASIDYDDKDD